MIDITKLKTAQDWIEKLANGINPLTSEPVKEDDIVNNVRLSRCFFYVSDILRQVIENGGANKKKSGKLRFELSTEELAKFPFSNSPIAISEIAKRLNSLITEENMITEEEINKILLSSPMVLPDNPTESGFKAKGIKELFYKYIRVLLGVIDTHLEGLDASTLRQILAHNDEKESHADIRELVRNLGQKDEEIYDQLIATITAHNEDEHAHPFYRGWAEMIQRKVDETYNLASGKSKIYPVSDVWEMLDSLSDKLNVGDKFVLATENVPDFILFEKNSTSKGAIPLSQMDLMLGLEQE